MQRVNQIEKEKDETNMKAKSNRREATPEQKEAAQARREAIKLLMAKVAEITPEKRVILANAYGIRNAEGRELSPCNQILLAFQCPTVSVVGGFAQWKALGRCVMKGSKALALWVPCGSRGEGATLSLAEVSGEGEEAGGKPRFVIGNVFDVSQTETIEQRALREKCEAPALGWSDEPTGVGSKEDFDAIASGRAPRGYLTY